MKEVRTPQLEDHTCFDINSILSAQNLKTRPSPLLTLETLEKTYLLEFSVSKSVRVKGRRKMSLKP